MIRILAFAGLCCLLVRATVLDSLRRKGVERNGIAADPLFMSLEDGDFRLREDSLALKAGIRSIDISGIGPRR